MQLLGDVRLDRIEPEHRWCDAGEGEHVFGDYDIRLAEDRIAERDVDAEGLTIDLARELALGVKAKPVVLHPVVLDLRVLVVRGEFKGHEVTEVPTARCLQFGEYIVGRAHHAEIDVLRGARAFEAELEDEPAL